MRLLTLAAVTAVAVLATSGTATAGVITGVTGSNSATTGKSQVTFNCAPKTPRLTSSFLTYLEVDSQSYKTSNLATNNGNGGMGVWFQFTPRLTGTHAVKFTVVFSDGTSETWQGNVDFGP